jgi:hypothetical protein
MVTGSIGIACCPLHAVEQPFLRNADLALHRPKRRAQSLESVRPQSAYAVRNHAAENALIRYAQTAVQHAQHKQRTDEQKAQVFKKDGFLPSIW